MVNRPVFTQEQVDYICYQIGDWYLSWKTRMTDGGQPHKLGVAKEQLKVKLFPMVCAYCQENHVDIEGVLCMQCAIDKALLR